MEASLLLSVKRMVAVITGGGSGLGLVMAKALEANGAAKVFIVGRRLEKLQEAARQAKYGNIIPMQGDVTSRDDLARICASIKASTGYINLLIANAGAIGPSFDPPVTPTTGTIAQLQAALWRIQRHEYAEGFEVNFTATLYTIIAFLELLDAGNKKGNLKQQSHVIATGSAHALNKSPVVGFGYPASKAAQLCLVKQMAVFLEPWKIRANVFAPGLFRSDMTDPLLHKRFPDGKIPRALTPMERCGEDTELAAGLLYLASVGGGYSNGSVLLMDGGRLLVNPSFC